ncbi:MAG: xylulokinase [Thermomicrobiales bacterium]|nr:xylulokinase [Thermomicrobiales bacterium]
MRRAVVLGVDSSTQSTKVLVVDLESGEEVAEGRSPHTGADTQDPRDWWKALKLAIAQVVRGDMDIRGISVAGQQHGMVTLDAAGEPVRPAPLWNNVDAAPDAERLNVLADFPSAVGSRLVASFTIAKLAHLARTSPADLARTVAIGLPHDYLNLRLSGALATDRGDASGTGWWSPIDGTYWRSLLALAIGAQDIDRIQFPHVCGPEEPAGRLTPRAAADLGLPIGIPVGPGSGDNPAAAVGIGATNAELVVSLGTSGTAYAVSTHPTTDPSGEVAGFADATGHYLPLACMLNCTRVLDTVAAMFGFGTEEALDRAGRVDPGAGGLLMLPYLTGERTPNLPHATASLYGVSAENASPDRLLRAAVDGVAAGIAYCIDALARQGVSAPNVTLVGGGARHSTWQQAIADVTGRPVTVRAGAEHVARGAAIQAAAIVRGETVAALAKRWRPPVVAEIAPRPAQRAAFRFDRRRELIESMKEEQRIS